MGLGFRKRIKILPGLTLNVGKRGVSASIGVKGASINVGGARGPRATIGLPGTGVNYSTSLRGKKTTASVADPVIEEQSVPPARALTAESAGGSERKVGVLLGIGILFMPYIFSWVLLRSGYSARSRVCGFAWLFVVLLALGAQK